MEFYEVFEAHAAQADLKEYSEAHDAAKVCWDHLEDRIMRLEAALYCVRIFEDDIPSGLSDLIGNLVATKKAPDQ